MKRLITEKHILDLQYAKVSNRPEMVLEGFQQLDNKEQKQINEAYNAVYDLIVSEVVEEASLSGAKAKLKGKFAGGMAALRGNQDAAGAGTQAELQSLFDDLKRNVGTIVAQHEKDVSQLGFKPDSNIVQMLNQIKQTIEQSPAQIEVKDSSIGGKAGKFAKEKIAPVVGKALSPITRKIEALYQKSGPIKAFDDKFENIKQQLAQKYPDAAGAISEFSDVAKRHKGKGSLIIGGLTAVLTATSVMSGGIGPVLLGVGLRGLYGVLAGEKPAVAFGKAAIYSVIGKLVGGAIKEGWNALFGDVDVDGAVEGSVEDSGEGLGVGPVEARHNALEELMKKYPDADNFDDLARLDPEAAEALRDQFTSNPGGGDNAETKISEFMSGNKVLDAGGESGTFRDGELDEVDGLIQVKDAESAIQRILQTTGDDSLHPNAIYGGRPDISFDLTGGGMTIDDVKISFAELDGEQLRNLEAGLKAHNINDARIWDSMARAARQSGAFETLETAQDRIFGTDNVEGSPGVDTPKPTVADIESGGADGEDFDWDSIQDDNEPINSGNYKDKIEELQELQDKYQERSMDPNTNRETRARYTEFADDIENKIDQLYGSGREYEVISRLKGKIAADVKEYVEFIQTTNNEALAVDENLQMIKQIRAQFVLDNYLDMQNKLPIDRISGVINKDQVQDVITKISSGDEQTINGLLKMGAKNDLLASGKDAAWLDSTEARLREQQQIDDF